MISPPSRGYRGKSNKVIDIKELWMSSEEFYKFKGPQYWHHGGLTVPSPPHNHTHPCLCFRVVGQTTGTLGAPECNVTFILIAPFSQFTCAQGWPGKIKKKATPATLGLFKQFSRLETIMCGRFYFPKMAALSPPHELRGTLVAASTRVWQKWHYVNPETSHKNVTHFSGSLGKPVLDPSCQAVKKPRWASRETTQRSQMWVFQPATWLRFSWQPPSISRPVKMPPDVSCLLANVQNPAFKSLSQAPDWAAEESCPHWAPPKFLTHSLCKHKKMTVLHC